MKIILHNTTNNNEKMEAHVAKCYIDKMNEFLAGELDEDQAAKWITPYQFIDIITNLKMQNKELRERIDTLENFAKQDNQLINELHAQLNEDENLIDDLAEMCDCETCK